MGSPDRKLEPGPRRSLGPIPGELDPGRAALVAALLLSLHLALLAYFAPRSVLQSGMPVLNDAFAIEAYRAFRARTAYEAWGTFAAYDPTVLAGQLAGTVELFGTRVFVLAVVLAARLGVAPARAFDATIVVLHASVPLVAYGAARAFRLGRGAALVTVALWTSLWYFDSLVHVAWFSGRIAWTVSCGLAILLLGVGSRVAAGHSPRWALAVLGVEFLALVVHPVPALAGAVVLAGLAWRRRGMLPWRRAVLLGSALAPLLALVPLGRRVAALSSEPLVRLFDCGISQIFWDFFEISSQGYRAPGATRTLFRFFAIVAGIAGLARFRASGDYRYAPLAVTAALGIAVAYLGGYVRIAWPVDPYFFLVLGVFAATIPAAAFVVDVDWRAAFGSRLVRAVALIGLFLGLPRFVRTAATFMPELLPHRVVRSAIDVMISPLVGVKEPLPDRLRHEAAPPSFAVVAEWFAEHWNGDGTILVDDPALAAYLSTTATLPILGPLGERGAPSAEADPTSLLAEPVAPDGVASYLERYAVGWVALWGAPSRFDLDDAPFEPVLRVAGVRIRKARQRPSFFLSGSGRVRNIAMGRVRISRGETTDAPAVNLALRFHYVPEVRCRPNCRVEPIDELAGSRAAPLIRIENAPPELELYFP